MPSSHATRVPGASLADGSYMIASPEALASHVAGHAGVAEDRASDVVRTVLGGLGAYLSPAARQLVVDELPAALGTSLDAGSRSFEAALGDHARELVASVCHVLAEELSVEALEALHRELPASLASLFAADEPTPRKPPERTDTLAAGRPGSKHPLSEAGDARQHDSVSDDNPHAATKLSSSRS